MSTQDGPDRVIRVASFRNPPAARVLFFLARVRARRLLRLFGMLLGGDWYMRHYPPLLLPHPYGITIHQQAGLGSHCVIFQNVTIGNIDGRSRPPILGDRVTVGANAVILGPIVIGDDATIGAGCVVTRDVPPAAVVAGNPARIVRVGSRQVPTVGDS